MQDFNIDSQEWFPNQQIDGDADECVAITVTDTLGDRDNINYDPDFTYAKTLQLEGVTPTNAGSDPWSGMLSAVGYGVLPMSDAAFTSLVYGEVYTANWQNYSADNNKVALTHAQNGARNVALDFDTVISEAKVCFGVSLPMLWFSSFMGTGADGILPPANGPTTNHNVRVVGQKTVNGVIYMLIKPWLGKQWGWGGYALMSKNQFILCAKAAYRFDSTANRFFSLLGIAITKFPYLTNFIPQLMNISSGFPPIVPNVDVLSPDWNSQKNAYHNVRVLCDLAGLTVDEKNLICACLYQESELYNYLPNGLPTTHENFVNGVLASTDWGIAQINDYWHVKKYPDFPSSNFILENPEKAVQFMIDAYKNGGLKQWVSYSSGAYQKWLLPNSPMWLLKTT